MGQRIICTATKEELLEDGWNVVAKVKAVKSIGEILFIVYPEIAFPGFYVDTVRPDILIFILERIKDGSLWDLESVGHGGITAQNPEGIYRFFDLFWCSRTGDLYPWHSKEYKSWALRDRFVRSSFGFEHIHFDSEIPLYMYQMWKRGWLKTVEF